MSAPAPRGDGDARVKVAAIIASAAVMIALLIYAPSIAIGVLVLLFVLATL